MASPEKPSRRRPQAWELRASVTADAYHHITDEADALGRSRTWHAGLGVEALARVSMKLSPSERTRLDELLREPTRLLEALRPTLAGSGMQDPGHS